MTLSRKCRANYIQELKRAYPADHVLFLKFGLCVIKVYSNTLEIKNGLSQYFNQFVCDAADYDIAITVHEAQSPQLNESFTIKPPDPGKTKIKEEFIDLEDGRIVRKRLTGMLFVFGGQDNLAVGPCEANLNQVINFINNRYIEWKLCKNCLLGHAAAVTKNGYGLAIAGFSGAGKSTLALHLMSKGLAFISNDRLMVEKFVSGLYMYGVGKLPRINPGTALNNPRLIDIMSEEEQEEFSTLPAEELWKLEHKYDAPIDDCFGPGKFVLEAPLSGLVVLSWKPNNGPAVIEMTDLSVKPQLLSVFMKSTGLFFYPDKLCRMPEPSIDNYLKLFEDTPVIECSGGIDFEKAVDACIRFLDMGTV